MEYFDTLGTGIGLQFEVKVHVVLQMPGTIFTGKSSNSLLVLVHMLCLLGHNQTFLHLAMHVLQCLLNSFSLLKDRRQSSQIMTSRWLLCLAWCSSNVEQTLHDHRPPMH